MTRTHKFLALFGLALAVGLYLRGCQDRKVDTEISTPMLSPKEAEKIIVDPKHHTITVVTPAGIKKSFVANRPTAVTVDKDGTVHVQTRRWGTEFVPFVGFSYSDALRPHIGMSVFFWNRFDLNLSCSPTWKMTDIRFVGSLSFNVYNNSFIFAGVDQKKDAHVGLYLRF